MSAMVLVQHRICCLILARFRVDGSEDGGLIFSSVNVVSEERWLSDLKHYNALQ